MSVADDLRRFVLRTTVRRQATYVGLATRVHRSIVGDGTPDPVTTAPGQPVDTGFLLDSWTLAIGPSEAAIQTNVAYARVIEDDNPAAYNPDGEQNDRTTRPDGVGRASITSKVGGAHSVKLTIAGASALQADVVRELGP